MPLYLFILKRILIAIPVLLIVSLISFTLMRFDFTIGPVAFEINHQKVQLLAKYHIKTPVDPLAELRQNPQISKTAYEQERKRLGLDKPFMVQYGLWLTHFVQGDLGKSFTGEDVSRLLMQRIPNTLLLNVIVLTACWLIAVPLGVYAALRWRTRLDSLMTLFSSVGMAIPSFVLALVLAVIAVRLGFPPVGGLTSATFETMNPVEKLWDIGTHLILPVTVLTIGSIAGLQRQMRGNLLDVLQAEYVRMARAKGLPENKVIYKHAVRTAINPLVTMLGFQLADLLSGAALVEMVLRYPGLGFTALEAARQTDTNLAMAVMVMGATLLVLGNLFADILLKVVDPKIELQ